MDQDPIIDQEDLDIDEEQSPLYEHYRFVVDKGQVPLRIDKFTELPIV